MGLQAAIHTSYPHLLFTPPIHTFYPHLLSTLSIHTSYPHLLSTPPIHTSYPHPGYGSRTRYSANKVVLLEQDRFCYVSQERLQIRIIHEYKFVLREARYLLPKFGYPWAGGHFGNFQPCHTPMSTSLQSPWLIFCLHV